MDYAKISRFTVVGLQETKWFGCDVYDEAGLVVLVSGRPLPDACREQLSAR